jgi:hypothetical protein
MNKVERTADNGYINNVNLANQMRAGEVERNESFLTFVEGLEALYNEAVSMRGYLYRDNDDKSYPYYDFEGWIYHRAKKIYTKTGFSIAHHKAKESIYEELESLKARPSDEELQAIVHKWDMWHYS